MSNKVNCEADTHVEAFLRELATESAEIVAARIPLEYREDYLTGYAAGLLLNHKVGCEVQYA